MPPRDHWPKRPRSFEWEDSQVVGFIMDLGASLAEAPGIFDAARMAKGNKRAAIFSDHSKLTWRGAFGPARLTTQKKSPGPMAAIGSSEVGGGEGAQKLAGEP